MASDRAWGNSMKLWQGGLGWKNVFHPQCGWGLEQAVADFKCLENAFEHMVWLLELSCAGTVGGLNDPCGSLPLAYSVILYWMHPWKARQNEPTWTGLMGLKTSTVLKRCFCPSWVCKNVLVLPNRSSKVLPFVLGTFHMLYLFPQTEIPFNFFH